VTLPTSPTGWLAVYGSDNQTEQNRPGSWPVKLLPVDGWNADGEALVVDEALGCRRPATHMKNFRRLQKAEPSPAAVLPGQGWHVAYRNGATPDPVVGWNVDSNGWAVPIIANSDGYAEPYDLTDEDFLVPPGVATDASPYRREV
jgi:hypothetical protein